MRKIMKLLEKETRKGSVIMKKIEIGTVGEIAGEMIRIGEGA